MLGATRSGKSTLGNFMRAMWMQYLRAQAKVFDVDRHATPTHLSARGLLV